MRNRALWAAGLSSAVLLLGCSSEHEGAKPSGGAEVLFGPLGQSELTPYPSNRYTVPDSSTSTGLRVTVTEETTNDEMLTGFPDTVAQLNTMDGFSTTGGVFVKFSSPIEPRGLAQLPDADPPIIDPVRDAAEYQQPDAPLLLVNVDDSSPERGEAVGLVLRYFEQEQDEFYIADEFTLLAQPAVPLRSGTRYVLVVTDRVRDAKGRPVRASRGMAQALAGKPDAYAAGLSAAVTEASTSVGFDPKRVVGATVFTTAAVTAEMSALSQARRAAAAPELVDPWTVEQQSSGDGRVRFRASFSSPEYRSAKPEGKWTIETSGVPKQQKDEALEVYLAFSDRTASGPRPVVFFAHGLGGDKDGCWGTAERLAELSARGVAVIAIDSPEHGSRAVGDTNLISSVYGFFGIEQGTNDFDIERARDNFRQMAADQLELVRFVSTLGALDVLPLDAEGNPAPDGEPDLDVSRFLYIGHSFGAVQGPTIFALAPEIHAANWNVGGAGLMMLLRDSNLFSLVVSSMTPPGTPFGAVARFMAATQALVDPGDPLNYARFATLEALPGVPGWTERDVLLQEVVNDTIVPNSTSEAVARAAGLGILNRVTETSGLGGVAAPASANLPGGNTGVLCQFDKMHGNKAAEHGELIFSPEGRAQYVEFFKSALDDGRARVVAPY